MAESHGASTAGTSSEPHASPEPNVPGDHRSMTPIMAEFLNEDRRDDEKRTPQDQAFKDAQMVANTDSETDDDPTATTVFGTAHARDPHHPIHWSAMKRWAIITVYCLLQTFGTSNHLYAAASRLVLIMTRSCPHQYNMALSRIYNHGQVRWEHSSGHARPESLHCRNRRGTSFPGPSFVKLTFPNRLLN